MLNAQISTPSFYLIGHKVRTVVSNDTTQDTIMVHHAGYEVYNWSGLGHFDWFGFYPLSEFVDHNQ